MELKDNSGLLFRNDKKAKDNQPDYTGQCLIGGKLLRMSAWLKTSKNGGKFMSFSFQEPYDKGKGGKKSTDDSAIPF